MLCAKPKDLTVEWNQAKTAQHQPDAIGNTDKLNNVGITLYTTQYTAIVGLIIEFPLTWLVAYSSLHKIHLFSLKTDNYIIRKANSSSIKPKHLLGENYVILGKISLRSDH